MGATGAALGSFIFFSGGLSAAFTAFVLAAVSAANFTAGLGLDGFTLGFETAFFGAAPAAFVLGLVLTPVFFFWSFTLSAILS
jgi:hypothetical protein